MSVAREDILDGFTCRMFGLEPESQGPKIAEYVMDVLKKRGYQSIHNHGWSMVKFRKDCFEYAIWIEDQEYMQYGILNYIGKANIQSAENKRGFFDRYHENGDLNYLGEFLDKVDRNEWGLLEKISLELKKLEEKYGEDFFYILEKQAY